MLLLFYCAICSLCPFFLFFSFSISFSWGWGGGGGGGGRAFYLTLYSLRKSDRAIPIELLSFARVIVRTLVKNLYFRQESALSSKYHLDLIALDVKTEIYF